MNKLTKFCLFLIFAASLNFPGWGNNSNKITNYYYYKDQPFYLKLKTDKLFVKLDKQLTESEFRSKLTSISPVCNFSAAYDEKDKRYFIELYTGINESTLLDFTEHVKSIPDVQYCSPVFSPDEGKTLIGVEDEIIVQFKSSVFQNEINSFLQSKNLAIVQQLSLTGGTTYVLRVEKYGQAIDAANEVYASGLVNWSEPNLYFTNLLCFDPNDTYYPMQWSQKNLGNNIPEAIIGNADCDMDVDSAWDITTGISQCKIAIIDTGIDTLHEDLVANMVVGSGYDFYNNDPYAWDDGNHGTCCAGIVAAVGNNGIGVSGNAPGCKLIPVKWLSSSGNGNYTGAINSVIWAYQKGAWVLSNSWGFVGGSSTGLDNAINDAAALGRNGKGSLFVVASGNENGTMRYPANTHPKVLVVGGISPCNQRKSPSSCDNESWWGASYGSNLDVVAPCVKVYSTDRTGSVGYSSTNYFATFNGTSSATPNVAGVCALAFSRDSSMSWDTLRVRIDRTCEKRGSYTYNQAGPRSIGQWNNEMGYGLVNARLLLLSLGPPPPPMNHDIAVGPFLSLPTQLVINNPYTIRTKVTNAGTTNETNVPIKFYINAALTNTTNINLNAAAVDSVSNEWTPISPGNYTLRYISALATDTNRVNDTVTTIVTVLPSVPVPVSTEICRNGLNINILDYQTIKDSIVVNISNALDVIDVNVKIDTLTHTYDSDLSFLLLHEAGSVSLINRRGSSGKNFINTRLNDSATTPVSSGTAPFNGEYSPEQPLAGMNGLAVNGSWVLQISDNAGGDTGYLKAWCITIVYNTLVGGIQTITIPNYYSLEQNYPNPFNPSTSIKFNVPKLSSVKLVVYDLVGREVATLVNGMKQAGSYEAIFNAENFASGVYFYRLEAGDFTDVKKMVLIK